MSNTNNFSQKNVIRNFKKAAPSFDAAAFLFTEINKRMIQRLEAISIKPKNILDCGAGTGLGTELLCSKFPKAQITALDISQAMLQQLIHKKTIPKKTLSLVCADAIKLPFANRSFDFVYANLMLHWCNKMDAVFSEWQRILKPEGLLMFTIFGPDTGKELFNAVQKIDASKRVFQFIDMHDLGDLLLKNQMLDPVMDVENFQLNYKSSSQLLRELRSVGGRNLFLSMTKHLLGKSYKKKLESELETIQSSDAKIPLSIEVIYGHAWASGLTINRQKGTEVEVPLFSIKKLFGLKKS